MIIICPHCSEVFETIPAPMQSNESKYDKALEIIEACLAHYRVTESEIIGKRRTKHLAACRHMAMYLIRKYCRYSHKDTAAFFFKDHTTTIHAEKRIENSLFTKGDLFDDLLKLEKVIKQPQLKVA